MQRNLKNGGSPDDPNPRLKRKKQVALATPDNGSPLYFRKLVRKKEEEVREGSRIEEIERKKSSEH